MDPNRETSLPVSRVRRRRYLRRRRATRLDLARSNSETTVRSSSALASPILTSPPTITIPLECNINTALLNSAQPGSVSGQPIGQSSSNTKEGSLPTTSCFDNQASGLSTPETIIEEPKTLSANPVRVLFKDQQQQLTNQQSTNIISSNTQSPPLSNLRSAVSTAQVANPIVNANRRLIERQIEAIQAADSHRWNFDFQNCQPLTQTGHRYLYNTPETLRNCRPLNDQNQSIATRLNSNPQQCRLPTSQGDACQHRSSDHEQQKDN